MVMWKNSTKTTYIRNADYLWGEVAQGWATRMVNNAERNIHSAEVSAPAGI